MSTRAYDFTTGIETPAAPTSSDPTSSTDFVTLGYVSSRFARGVADVAAVKAIDAASRASDSPVWVTALAAWFIFNTASTATGNDLTVITPTAGTGRWLRLGGKVSFTIANNTASQNVTGLVFDKMKVRSFEVGYTVFRSAAGGQTRAVKGWLQGVTDGTNWYVAQSTEVSDAGVTFDISAAGQVTLNSDDNLGTYAAGNSVLKYSIDDLVEV